MKCSTGKTVQEWLKKLCISAHGILNLDFMSAGLVAWRKGTKFLSVVELGN